MMHQSPLSIVSVPFSLPPSPACPPHLTSFLLLPLLPPSSHPPRIPSPFPTPPWSWDTTNSVPTLNLVGKFMPQDTPIPSPHSSMFPSPNHSSPSYSAPTLFCSPFAINPLLQCLSFPLPDHVTTLQYPPSPSLASFLEQVTV